MDIFRHYIDGRWTAPATLRQMTVINPATGDPYGTIPLADISEVEAAVTAARNAFPGFGRLSRDDRIALLESLVSAYEKRMDEMTEAIITEMGATRDVAEGEQVQSGQGHLGAYVQALKAGRERYVLENGDTIIREPIGVAALITPWNWPMNQVTLKVGAALAAGCPCILKPSEYTPLSSVLFTEMVHDAGYPDGAFNMIQGDGPLTGAALVRHPDVDMVSFTGSTRAGRAISKGAADSIKKVTLELGGKSPNIVFADCGDALDERVRDSVAFCFYNQGQSCDAPTRLLVERTVYDQVVAIAEDAGVKQALGNPAEAGSHLGPLVNRVQFDRVQRLINIGVEEGARLLCGGTGRPAGFEKGYYVKPTIFADVLNSMTIAREEIFGPVLSIIPFDTEEEAIAIANDTPYGLAAYIQTGSRERAERVAASLRAGAVHVNNRMQEWGTPFGGYKMSGIGREGGSMGLEDFQEVKSLHVPEGLN